MDHHFLGAALFLVLIAGLAGVGVAAWRRPAARRSRWSLPRRGLLLLLLPKWLGQAAQAAAQDGQPAAMAGKPITRIRLHNTHARATQVAHFVTPMFGQGFRQGDMPAGQQPRFVLADGTHCPATVWATSTWPDGSMKFCAVMARIPSTIAANGSLEVHVHAGSMPPKMQDARSLDDLVQADMAVQLEGATALEGRWTASLNDGIRTRANVVQIASGPAGAIWRIGSEFRNAAGAAHGQLYCWHYVAALSGPSDALLGLRYLGRVAQPWTDVAQPKAQHREFSASLRSGTQLLRSLRGHAATETPGDLIRLPHYASFFTAGPDARWDYISAGGRQPDDCTVRVTVDVPYLCASRLIPPYDLELAMDAAPTVDYVPMGRGTVTRYMGTTGEREDIGLLPEWNVRHLIAQDEGHERVARVNALSAGGWRIALRKRQTYQPVPCVDLRPHYAGLGRPEPDWRGYQHLAGMVKPEPNNSLWAEDTAHRPGCFYWPYLLTGEPQYLDLLVENAFAHILGLHQGNASTWGTTFPRTSVLDGEWGGERGVRIGPARTLYKGAGVLMSGTEGTRGAAWRSRDVAQALALSPDHPPDRAAVRDYLSDVMQSAYAAFGDYTSKVPGSFRNSGLFVQSKLHGAPWQLGYLSWSVCHQSDILGTKDSSDVRQYLSRFWSSYATHADMACIVAYVCTFWNDDGTLLTSTEQALGNLESTLRFDATTGRVSISASKNKNNGSWKARDGDAFSFTRLRSPQLGDFLKGRDQRRLYAVNCEGQSFQLADQPGGAPLALPNITVTNFLARLRDFSPNVVFDSSNSSSGYSANISGAVAYHGACGDDVAAPLAQLKAMVQRQRINFRNRPKYCARSERV